MNILLTIGIAIVIGGCGPNTTALIKAFKEIKKDSIGCQMLHLDSQQFAEVEYKGIRIREGDNMRNALLDTASSGKTFAQECMDQLKDMG